MIDDAVSGSLARRFEAVMFDWDGTAVADRNAGRERRCARRGALCAAGRRRCDRERHAPRERRRPARCSPDGAGTIVDGAQSRIRALRGRCRRPAAALSSRGESPRKMRAVTRRRSDRRPSRARGLEARDRVATVEPPEDRPDPAPGMGRPAQGRRSIDLLAAVEQRLRAAGIARPLGGRRARDDIAREAGFADPRVTSDAKHVEIGLTDKSDSARAVVAQLWADGIAAGAGPDRRRRVRRARRDARQRLVHDRFRGRGRDGLLGRHRAQRRAEGVVHLDGGPAGSSRCCATSCGAAGPIPSRRVAPRRVVVRGRRVRSRARRVARSAAHDRRRHDRHQRCAVPRAPGGDPELMAAGVYDGDGPLTDLLPGPRWAALGRASRAGRPRAARARPAHRCARRAVVTARRPRASVRFSSLARPGVAVLRADVDPPETSDRARGARRRCSSRSRRRIRLDGDARDRRFDHRRRVAGARRDAASTGSPRTCRADGAEPERGCRARGARAAGFDVGWPNTGASGRGGGNAPTCASPATTSSSSTYAWPSSI
jgi:hypothetical protein